MTAVVTAVFTPLEGRKDELVAALRETMPGVHAEPGCELYAIHDAEDGTVTMIEKWTTREDLDAHSRGEAVAALQAATGELLAGPVDVVIMTPLPAGTAEQGEL
ncbi:antibiotic biosynthesis monooxygenase [Arsenicicoccus piscis]|uniref:Antibiotic biosynthesis monooxygenase n=1 Tax=Arsenicicoccus piscis TaxID=673954 RepID=A0ABQ6HSL2_9MICO|nr:putative quinol monooxygenase [Arsenicicoccus piscis]MCH8627330.1 antibiotic biosynthesis monooxygenase [Arsenicicoccus piscis]GMA21476.1 antibiotic biosynthesis monooxygenase [Arsenicicoccus piscis]